MNKGTSRDREENKNERSRRPKDSRKFSTSSDQIGKGNETMTKKSQHRRSSSMGVESQRQTKENWTDHDFIRQRNGPVTRIVPIHMEGDEASHQVTIKRTERRGRSETRGGRQSRDDEMPVKVTYVEANANVETKTFIDSNGNCDAFTQTFQGDKRNNCVLS